MDMNNFAFFITPFTALLFVNSVINYSMDSFIMCGTFFLALVDSIAVSIFVVQPAREARGPEGPAR